MRQLRAQRGLTLVEVLAALCIGAIVLAALDSLAMLGLAAQRSVRQTNELLYQGRFALDRMAAKARASAPKLLSTPAAGTTGDWFAPTMYCRTSDQRLVETTDTDTACAGTTVIANNVTDFSATLPDPGNAGPADDPVATLSLTVQSPGAGEPLTLTTSVRLGGGTLLPAPLRAGLPCCPWCSR